MQDCSRTGDRSHADLPLSICIPVFNFGDVLDKTLDSILPQTLADIEVLVVDGASIDNTEELVAVRTSRWPQLRYVKLDRRRGIDRDLATSVALARGEYCWLFSGDDIMRPGAIERALEHLRAKYDVYVCRHTVCDRDMRLLREYPIFREDRVRVADFGEPLERNEWMKAATNTEAIFSFMSGLIVRRKTWLSSEPPEKFVGSCWGHVARLLTLARKQLSVCYVAETWLDRRGDNDSFRDRGIVNRFRIAIEGYLGIASYFYGEGSPEIEHVRRFLRNELSVWSFFYARERIIEHPDEGSRAELDRLFELCYSGRELSNRLNHALYRTLPIGAYRGLRTIHRGVDTVLRGLRDRIVCDRQ